MTDGRDPAVHVIAVAVPAEGQEDAVRDALVAAVGPVHAEEGCERYALNARDDGAFVMIERWSSPDLLDAHGRGQNLQTLNAALDGRLAKPLEVTVLRPIAAGDPVKGSL